MHFRVTLKKANKVIGLSLFLFSFHHSYSQQSAPQPLKQEKAPSDVVKPKIQNSNDSKAIPPSPVPNAAAKEPAKTPTSATTQKTPTTQATATTPTSAPAKMEKTTNPSANTKQNEIVNSKQDANTKATSLPTEKKSDMNERAIAGLTDTEPTNQIIEKVEYLGVDPNNANARICKIYFIHDRYEVKQEDIMDCFKDVKADNIEYIDVFGTASPDGNLEYNFILSQNRAKHTAEAIQGMFPETYVRQKAGGVNIEHYRSVTIYMLLNNKEPQPILVCPKVKRKLSVWGGFAKYYPSGNLSNYIPKGSNFWELGASMGLFPLNTTTDLYAAITLNFMKIIYDLSKRTGDSSSYKSINYRGDAAVLAGLDMFLHKRNFSWFVEAGPAFQHRVFMIRQSPSTFSQDYYIANVFGLTGNIGLKYSYDINNKLAVFARARLNLAWGQAVNTDPLYYKSGKEDVNVNSYSWSPLIALGLTF